MAYVIKKATSYKWPVVIEDPDEGKFKPEPFKATFKRLGKTEFSELADQGDDVLIQFVLLDWDGVTDEDGNAVPCTTATKAERINDPYFCRGVIKFYLESLGGAQAKN